MQRLRPLSGPVRPSLSFSLLVLMLIVLWLAGGASVATVIGQVIVRAMSVVLLIIATLFSRHKFLCNANPVWIILGGAIVLALLQLVPLSPALWQALPGRTIFTEAALANGQLQPWRPLAIVPGGAINAAASLIVPLTVLLLVDGLTLNESKSVPGLLLGIITGAMLVGLLQFSGADITNPLVNAERGAVDGLFANRNHFALFLAVGCVVAPVWAYNRDHSERPPSRARVRWRGPVAFALVVLFVLVILASGSRAGVPLGFVGIGGGLLLVRRNIGHGLTYYQRWIFPAAFAGTLALVVLVSILSGRAVSINRLLTDVAMQDLRVRNLPIVLGMVWDYFPAGSGFGGFAQLFRIHEPLASLQPEYFNHAHNDFVEVVLDGGLLGLLLLVGAVTWWAAMSVRAWRLVYDEPMTARMGSAILLLVLTASSVDYPARTPLIMAVIVIAATWLCVRQAAPAPLPTPTKNL